MGFVDERREPHGTATGTDQGSTVAVVEFAETAFVIATPAIECVLEAACYGITEGGYACGYPLQNHHKLFTVEEEIGIVFGLFHAR